MQLTEEGKQKIIEAIENLKPFERIEIIADRNANSNKFIIHKERTEIIVQKICRNA